MSRLIIKKIVVLITALVIIRLFVVYTFDYVNEKNTSYIQMKDDTISSSEVVQGSTKALILEKNDDQMESYIFYLESHDKRN